MNISQFMMSLRKEFWEHKSMLFWLPVILLVIMVSVAILGLSLMDSSYQFERLINQLVGFNQALADAEANGQVIRAEGGTKIVSSMIFSLFLFVGFIVQVYYFCACLFDDRRDLSVYFWRSVPVSDFSSVICKLVAGVVMIPAIFMGAATALCLLICLLMIIVFTVLEVGYGASLWGVIPHLGIVSNLGLIWANIVVYGIWIFPACAWLMLASAFAKKSPFVWAILPIIILLVVEAFMVNYLGFDGNSRYLANLLQNYFELETGTFPNQMRGEMERPGMIMLNAISDKISIFAIMLGSVFMYGTYWLRANRSQA